MRKKTLVFFLSVGCHKIFYRFPTIVRIRARNTRTMYVNFSLVVQKCNHILLQFHSKHKLHGIEKIIINCLQAKTFLILFINTCV